MAEFLGERMAQEFIKHPELTPIDWVVPVPLHPKKRRMRGYNQSQLLAESFCKRTGLSLRGEVLLRQRDTLSQAHLKRQERLINMLGAFAALPDVKGKRILLIDDVATTGATLEGCAAALKQAGAKQVMAFTLAREP